MSPAQWLCYRPRVFERGGRNYQVETGGQSSPGALLDAFTAAAEDLLRAAQGRSLTRCTHWRYAPLGAPGHPGAMALCRCALARQADAQAQAPVVWALLVPHAQLSGERCALDALAPLFPGSACRDWPQPPDLSVLGGVSATVPVAGVAHLIACWLAHGRVEVSLAPAEALAVLAHMVQELPPRDRLDASFSTLPASTHSTSTTTAFSVSAAAPPLTALRDPQACTEGLARLTLWRLVRGRLRRGERERSSLRGEPLTWLADGLDADRPDNAPAAVAERTAALLRELPAQPRAVAAVAQAALTHLRGVLAGAPGSRSHTGAALCAAAAAVVLERLAGDGLPEDSGAGAKPGAPPPAMSFRSSFRSYFRSWGERPQGLSPETVPAVVTRARSAADLALLAQMLAEVPPDAALAAACGTQLGQILAAGVRDENLAQAVALLLLHDHSVRAA